jgi:hypothetical protein
MADDTNIPMGTDATGDSKEPLLSSSGFIEPETPVVTGTTSVPAATAPAPQTVPAAPAIIPEDETELERINRLKLDTDGTPQSGAIKDDIAKILAEIKLPERRDFKGTGDARAPVASSAPVAPVATAVPDTGASKPKERDIVTALHTLKDDVQDVVRTRSISMVRATALEQDKKREKLPQVVSNPGIQQRRRRAFGLIFFAILLIVLGGAALFGVGIIIKDRATTPATSYPSLIFAESTETLPIDNTTPATLKATIAQARKDTQAPLGSITRIIPTVSVADAAGATSAQPATLQQFFTALGLQAPAELMQGLGSTFFFGIHAVGGNVPVFVIPVISYDHAFAGMLAWEPTMDQDLAPAYDAVPALVTDSSGLPETRTFTDAVLLNYDVRELKDDSGNIVLYYSFPTPNILVIAENPSTFAEVLSRLEAQREL